MKGCSEKESFEKLEIKKYEIEEVDVICFYVLKCGPQTMENGHMKAGQFFLNLFSGMDQVDN